MYYMIYAGHGAGFDVFGSSYGETIAESCEGLQILFDESVSASDDAENADYEQYEKLINGELTKKEVENLCLTVGDESIEVLLFISDREKKYKQRLCDFFTDGPVDFDGYYSEDDDLDDNLRDYLDDLPALFDKLEEIFEIMNNE